MSPLLEFQFKPKKDGKWSVQRTTAPQQAFSCKCELERKDDVLKPVVAVAKNGTEINQTEAGLKLPVPVAVYMDMREALAGEWQAYSTTVQYVS